MAGREFPRLLRTAAQVEARMRQLEGARQHTRTLQPMETPHVINRLRLRPQPLKDADLLGHERIAIFLCEADAVGHVLPLALAGDKIDGDTPAGELVVARDHACQHDWVNIARPRCNQHADPPVPASQESGGDPSLPAGHGHRHKHIFETSGLSSRGHPVEHLRARGNAVRLSIACGVAVARQVPAEFQPSVHAILRLLHRIQNPVARLMPEPPRSAP